MTALVVGASGATGRLLVEQLLNRGLSVKVIVRSTNNLTEALKNHDGLPMPHPRRYHRQRRVQGRAVG